MIEYFIHKIMEKINVKNKKKLGEDQKCTNIINMTDY